MLRACWPILLYRPRDAPSPAKRAQFNRMHGCACWMERGNPEVQAGTPTRNTQLARTQIASAIIHVYMCAAQTQSIFLRASAACDVCQGSPEVQAGSPTRNAQPLGTHPHLHQQANNYTCRQGRYIASVSRLLSDTGFATMHDACVRRQRRNSACPSRSALINRNSAAFEDIQAVLHGA
jgi:hypothetical protein